MSASSGSPLVFTISSTLWSHRTCPPPPHTPTAAPPPLSLSAPVLPHPSPPLPPLSPSPLPHTHSLSISPSPPPSLLSLSCVCLGGSARALIPAECARRLARARPPAAPAAVYPRARASESRRQGNKPSPAPPGRGALGPGGGRAARDPALRVAGQKILHSESLVKRSCTPSRLVKRTCTQCRRSKAPALRVAGPAAPVRARSLSGRGHGWGRARAPTRTGVAGQGRWWG